MLFPDVWSEIAALFKRLMTIHSNPPNTIIALSNVLTINLHLIPTQRWDRVSQGGPCMTTHASTHPRILWTGNPQRLSVGTCFQDGQIWPVSALTRSNPSSQVHHVS